MEAKAIQRYIKISPRKLRLVANFLNGLKFEEAVQQLRYMKTKAARWAEKTVFSAAANAEHNLNLDRKNLYIKSALAKDGPRLKRWRPVSRGVAHPILKRMSHLRIVLAEIESGSKEVKSKKSVLLREKSKSVQAEPNLLDASQKIRSSQNKKQLAQKPGTAQKPQKQAGSKTEIFDQHRQGRHRSKQHLDKTKMKQSDGAPKKIFRRKAV